MENLIASIIFVYGLCIGSFLNVLIWRLPQEKKITGRSKCAHCSHALAAWDLVPVFSYLSLLGKCRYCKKQISPRYFIIEILTGIIFLFSYLYFMPISLVGWIMFFQAVLALCILMIVFVVDLEHYIILDSVILFGVVFMSVFNIILDFLLKHSLFSLNSLFINGLLAAVAAAVPFFGLWFFSKGRAMGFGDVKLALFLGAFLGLSKVFVALFIGIMLGGAVGLVLMLFAGKNLKTKLPFGTFLSLGAFIALFWGEKILGWYLGLLKV